VSSTRRIFLSPLLELTFDSAVELYKIVVKLPPNAAVDISERRDASVAHEVLLQIHQNLVLSPAQARPFFREQSRDVCANQI
jgi:hypothetical protein